MKRFKKILKILLPLLMGIIATGNIFAQVYGWSALGNGVDGSVYAITMFNSRVIVAGSFTHAGGVAVSNIAQWDGSSWSPLGSGLDNTVYSLCVYNNSLYAGGSFLHSGSNSLNHIARWDGNWNQVGITGNGTNDDVKAMVVYNGNLIVAGNFFTAGGQNLSHIARLTNLNLWQPLGSSSNNGLNGNVNAMTVYNGDLFVGGSFTSTNQALLTVNRIAFWDESDWYNLGTGMNNTVNAITVWNNNLYAGGSFSTAGGVYSPYLAYWSGSVWQALTNQPPDDVVYSLGVVNGQLVAGGSFKNIGYPTQYGSRIARWNGSTWSRMITGMNSNVNTIYVVDTNSLYAGGNFNTAGGDYINHISMWHLLPTVTISGLARYADSLTIVRHGEVFAIRLDVATRELIKVDSTRIDSGSGLYNLIHVPTGDSLYILIFPNDVLTDNFVPTYHPSTIDWLSAVKVFPSGNLTNVNINVIRVMPNPEPNFVTGYNISGYVYLNYTPPLFSIDPGYPFSSGAIVYAKQGNTYRGFGISDINEQYVIPNMAPGTYDLFANRIGYNSGSRTITLGSVNYDTANFWLDTAGPIAVRKIGTAVPDKFTLNQNYPNPFNPVTVISYQLPSAGSVKLEVYDILGRRVAVLVDEKQAAGNYEVKWDATDISSGVYFYRMQTGSFSITKKMALIK